MLIASSGGSFQAVREGNFLRGKASERGGSSFESRNLEMDDRRRSLRRVYLSISLFLT